MKHLISILSLLIYLCYGHTTSAQSGAMQIIDQSIQYHDPEGLLLDGRLTLNLTETRPGDIDRLSEVILHPAKEYFKMSRQAEGVLTEMQLKKGKSSIKLNGKKKFSAADKEKYRLTDERLVSTSQYYRYLWMLPHVLKDPGTIIEDTYNIVDFFGRTCIEVKATYDPAVGKDIWYFYFNPETYALNGYRFYHDEAANDGEYIILDEETSFQSVRIPKIRAWYTHNDDEYLGSDVLDKLLIK
jgi:hypothetical protein